MAFEQTTRNRLARFVSDARSLLSEEFTRQLQNDYGLDPNSGDVTDLARLEHLDDARRETARLLRDTMEHYLAAAYTATPAKAKKARQDVLDRIVREQAFTILNRLCALRMAEARGLLIESIAKGYQSKGFQLYQRLAGTALGETGACYRLFIFSVFDEFAVDLPVLFDRFSPQGRLFPREAALLNVLQEINHPDIDPLWAEDETIGWIYQYFNSVEERRQMRAASQAPRNSRELAVRNQFFTPRYVVEFLTDNTLGRIWYEMTKGESSLKESCRYLVRRPNEIFLAEGEAVPEQDDTGEELSQEELLKQPVHILHRPLKDPRDIKMLDPACGSMHFGLYAFDLFERIYEEAWEIEAQRGADGFVRTEGLEPLYESYTDKDAFLRDVPRLIIERNIHGIDIDPRAVQIAGLSLWLRAQRSWQVQNVKALDRPQIQRSNIVCAEPMPGEADMLEEFTEQLQPKVLGQLVKIIFEKMKLAGEAGSLLKIEEEIKDAVNTANEAYRKYLLDQQKGSQYLPGMAPEREATLFDFAGLSEEDDFWNTVELRVIDALRDYSEQAEYGIYQRCLFANEAAQGFAFIDLCRKRYDAVVMNPPFGLMGVDVYQYATRAFPNSYCDFGIAMMDRGLCWSGDDGYCGAITSRSYMAIADAEAFRRNVAIPSADLIVDLGLGVMDGAWVDSCCQIFSSCNASNLITFLNLRDVTLSPKTINETSLRSLRHRQDFSRIPRARLSYDVGADLESLLTTGDDGLESSRIALNRTGASTFEDERFRRLWWEPLSSNIGREKVWCFVAKSCEFNLFYYPYDNLVKWNRTGSELQERNRQVNGQTAQARQGSTFYFRHGISFSRRGEPTIAFRIYPSDCAFSSNGAVVLPSKEDDMLYILGLLNSCWVRAVIRTQAHKFSYTVGHTKVIKWLQPSDEARRGVSNATLQILNRKRTRFSLDERDHHFVPQCHGIASRSIAECFEECHRRLQLAAEQDLEDMTLIDGIIEETYNLDSSRVQLQSYNVSRNDVLDPKEIPFDSVETFTKSLISQIFGASFGRWDVRYLMGERQAPELPDPFEPLPACPPGMLQNRNGLPVQRKELPMAYPLPVPWSGILIDDKTSCDDIVVHMRIAFSSIGNERAEIIEQEVCDILGVPSLRAYFRQPFSFFADHLKRYTKSRRQAPIYWPLSTPSCSYAIWLYYHRLTDQTLYICVNDYVDPKLKQVSGDATSLRGKANRSSVEEIELERLIVFEQELKDFRDELLRIASFWKPNLNDGVPITAAPLWNLFQHRQWKAHLKETWEKLEAGEYDWAHLALSIWPDRVIRASHKDRSYAIAHGLEDELWHEVEVERVGRGGRVTTTTEWQPRDLSNEDMLRIIAKVKARCHQG